MTANAAEDVKQQKRPFLAGGSAKWYNRSGGQFGSFLKSLTGTSLVIQWLRLHAPNAGGPGCISSQGTRFHMPQLKDTTCHNKDQRSHVLQLRPRAAK